MLLEMQVSNHVQHNNLASMHNNKNANNNHNTRNTSPIRGSAAKPYKPDNNVNGDGVNQEERLEESRRVVESFLKRSLSQNAKTSMETMRPEGYHKLKRDGRLAFYQRQQSKPEQGTLVRKDLPNRSESFRPTVAGLPSRPSLNELTSEAKKISMMNKPTNLSPLSASDQDIHMTFGAEESVEERGSPMIESLINDDSLHSGFQSSDSLGSIADDGMHMRRRKSFTRATRKSVISYIEQKKRQRESSGETSTAAAAPVRRSVEAKGKSKTPDVTRKFSTKAHRKLSVSEPLASTWHGAPSSDPSKSEDARSSLEKKPTLKERMKRLMAGPSNKKRLQYRKSFEVRQEKETEEPPHHSRSREYPKPTQSEEPVAYSPAVPRRGRSPADRSPSPPKTKNISKLFRSTSTKVKPSPKVKRVTLPKSTSSNSIDALATGNLERDKSGSLPLSVRYGVNYDEFRVSDKTRRFSGDFSSGAPKRPSSKKRDTTDSSASPVRPDHLDLSHKKKHSGGKFRKFIKFWRKRHPSDSSTSSEESCHSQSEPNLHHVLDEEEKRRKVDREKKEKAHSDGKESGDKLPEQPAPYHHRGSLSFSQGDLDNLSLPEKQKIYDEIAETLKRISIKYNRHIQSRSSTPGSRIITPESSFSSSQEYRYSLKSTRSDPPARQNSRGPTHPTNRSFRTYTDANQPAMNAFMNLSNHQKTSRSNESLGRFRAAKMPKTQLVRRHTQHTFTGSFDSPYNRHRVSRKRASPQAERRVDVAHFPPARETHDVPDGLPPTETDHAAPPNGHANVRTSHTRGGSIISEEDLASFSLFRDYSSTGSEVDHERYYHVHSEVRSAGYGEPGTSTTQHFEFEARDTEKPAEQIDEDKLVQQLVQVLCQKGDEYTRSIDMPPIPVEPAFQLNVARYMATTTFGAFQQFANRFCNNMRQLVEGSPTRHPEVFPIVMVLNMTQLVVDIVSSQQTVEAVENAVNFSTRMFGEFCRGRSMESFLNDLNETEEELSSVETPSSEERGSPRRAVAPPSSDEEVD